MKSDKKHRIQVNIAMVMSIVVALIMFVPMYIGGFYLFYALFTDFRIFYEAKWDEKIGAIVLMLMAVGLLGQLTLGVYNYVKKRL